MSRFGWAALLLIAGALHAQTPPDYETLPGSKALAVSPGAPAVYGLSHDQPNDLQAALSALQLCEARRTNTQSRCEIRRLNDEQVTPGAQIRAGLTSEPHPLYLWRLHGPRATVYLAGSVHILKPSLHPLPALYLQAFQVADRLVLEVDVDARAPEVLQQKTLSYASLEGHRRIDDVLSPSLLARLSDSLARHGVPLAQVASLKPAYLMNQLVLLRLTALGYQADSGLEQYFLGQVGDREVLELETIDLQLSLLFDQPMETQIQLLEETLDQERDIEPLLAAMIRAWFAGDDGQFMAMFNQQSGTSDAARRFTEALLDDRNIGMARTIRSYLESGSGTYFVLVGAAHLIGDRGIPALLAGAGIDARRLNSDDTIP